MPFWFRRREWENNSGGYEENVVISRLLCWIGWVKHQKCSPDLMTMNKHTPNPPHICQQVLIKIVYILKKLFIDFISRYVITHYNFALNSIAFAPLPLPSKYCFTASFAAVTTFMSSTVGGTYFYY